MKLINNSFKRLSVILAGLASVASLHAATFQFDSGGSNVGGANNTRTFSSGGITVDVTGWSRLGQGSDFSQSFVGQYGGGGLGVTNDNESSTDPEHKVDNLSSFDYLLFKFNGPVVVDSLDLRSVGADSDLRYWIGNSGALPTAGNIQSTFITGALFTSDSLTSSGNSRIADINNSLWAGNYLLIAPVPSSSDDDDEFKVFGATASRVPDNGSTVALMGLGLVGMVALRKRFLA